jgi:hypothetical protein
VQALVGGLAFAISAVLGAWRYEKDLKERFFWLTKLRGQPAVGTAYSF